jgi:hypothetical protein
VFSQTKEATEDFVISGGEHTAESSSYMWRLASGEATIFASATHLPLLPDGGLMTSQKIFFLNPIVISNEESSHLLNMSSLGGEEHLERPLAQVMFDGATQEVSVLGNLFGVCCKVHFVWFFLSILKKVFRGSSCAWEWCEFTSLSHETKLCQLSSGFS